MRARNIKPAFFKNYDLADCGAYAQILFAGLWCLADKDGLLENKPRLIKAEIFPYYDVDINGELTKLERLGFIRCYTSSGYNIIEVMNFRKHQNPHHTEKSSKLPKYEESCAVSDCKQKENNFNESLTVNSRLNNGEYLADSLIKDSLIPDSLIDDSGMMNVDNAPEQQSTPQPKKANSNAPTSKPIDLLLDAGVDEQTAKDFLQVRAAKKLPLTATALKGIADEAVKAGLTTAKAVEIATKNGWAGFKASWAWQEKAAAIPQVNEFGRQLNSRELLEQENAQVAKEYLMKRGLI